MLFLFFCIYLFICLFVYFGLAVSTGMRTGRRLNFAVGLAVTSSGFSCGNLARSDDASDEARLLQRVGVPALLLSTWCVFFCCYARKADGDFWAPSLYELCAVVGVPAIISWWPRYCAAVPRQTSFGAQRSNHLSSCIAGHDFQPKPVVHHPQLARGSHQGRG